MPTPTPPTMGAELPPLPLAYEYVYGWADGARKLSPSMRNGRHPDTSETVYTRGQMRDYVLAAIAADRDTASRATPEGWVLVPRELTTAMLTAGADAVNNDGELLIQAAWLYMIEAAPPAGALPVLQPSVAVTEVLEQERQKFQQETRRTSELTVLLRKWVDRHEAEHGAGPWARGCELCALVDESQKLMNKPINVSVPWGTGLLAREELANDGHVGAGPAALTANQAAESALRAMANDERELGLDFGVGAPPAAVEAPKAVAWMHPDGRVVPAATMDGALRDGGAIKSSLAGYKIPLYTHPAPPLAGLEIDEKERTESIIAAEPWLKSADVRARLEDGE